MADPAVWEVESQRTHDDELVVATTTYVVDPRTVEQSGWLENAELISDHSTRVSLDGMRTRAPVSRTAM